MTSMFSKFSFSSRGWYVSPIVYLYDSVIGVSLTRGEGNNGEDIGDLGLFSKVLDFEGSSSLLASTH